MAKRKKEKKQGSNTEAKIIAGESMAKMFNKIVNDIIQNASTNSDEPLMYGINIRFSKEGFPIIENFENISTNNVGVPARTDPLVDVIDAKDEVSVIIEARDIDPSWISLTCVPKCLTVKITDNNASDVMNIDLPAQVNPKSAAATFCNGILEVTIRKVNEAKANSKAMHNECNVKIYPV